MGKKKATVVELPVAGLDIKLANGKAKATKPEQFLVDDPAIKATVDKCIKLDEDIENLIAKQAIEEEKVVNRAAKARDSEFENDNFVKTVNVSGTTHKLQIQFKDSYAKMDVAMEVPLQTVFGTHYPIMFRHNTIDTLIDVKKAELKAILGTRWAEFFTTEENIQPTTNFQQTYFTLRNSLKAEQTASIQKILESCQAKPAVKYPK